MSTKRGANLSGLASHEVGLTLDLERPFSGPFRRPVLDLDHAHAGGPIAMISISSD